MSQARARLRWLCRRGMGELDQLLRPFLEEVYPELPAQQCRAFEQLLELEDPALFALVSGREQSGDPDVAEVIRAIRRHAGH